MVASAYAGVDVALRKKAEFEEMKRAEIQKARHVSCGRCSPVSSIDPRALAMVDLDGPVLSPLGASGEADEQYLTPVKARVVDR